MHNCLEAAPRTRSRYVFSARRCIECRAIAFGRNVTQSASRRAIARFSSRFDVELNMQMWWSNVRLVDTHTSELLHLCSCQFLVKDCQDDESCVCAGSCDSEHYEILWTQSSMQLEQLPDPDGTSIAIEHQDLVVRMKDVFEYESTSKVRM